MTNDVIYVGRDLEAMAFAVRSRRWIQDSALEIIRLARYRALVVKASPIKIKEFGIASGRVVR